MESSLEVFKTQLDTSLCDHCREPALAGFGLDDLQKSLCDSAKSKKTLPFFDTVPF